MEFNQEQQEIINNIEGAYLISAPVGTGKTTVLTERVFKALESGIKPSEILCLTFTNRASEEMRARIKARLQDKNTFDQLTITTFHGFCAQFIRTEAKQIGIPTDFSIFDDDEQKIVFQEVISNFPQYQDQKWQQLSQILYKRRERNLENDVLKCNLPPNKADQDLDNLNQAYLQALKEQNALDFNQLVLLTLETLYTNKKIQQKWSKKFKFIQLDEFQDTHLSEYMVIKELAKEYKNISLIGDVDQTIYSWRGSNPDLIIKIFKAHFAPVQEFFLEKNYRFQPHVLAIAKSFLSKMQVSLTKEITSHQPLENPEAKAIIFGAHNFTEEVKWTISQIEEVKDKNPEASIAVLARMNRQIKEIANIFSENNIAHITVDKYDFFRRQEVKDVLAYIKIIFNKYDLSSAYRIVARPNRKIGIKTIKEIRDQGDPINIKVSDFLDFKSYNFKEPFAGLIQKHKSGRLIVLDTETTGTNPLVDDIIQIYAIEVINGQKGKEFAYYLKNKKPVGVSQEVHGLSDEFLEKEGQNPKTILQELKKFIGHDPVIGHNINFDLTMITKNAQRLGFDFQFSEFYDTLDLARRTIDSPSYKLTYLAETLGLAQATHDARDDVLATVDLLAIIVGSLEEQSLERERLFQKYSGKFIALANLIESWKSRVGNMRPAELLELVWEDSGLREFYEQDKESSRRLESYATLKNLFASYDNPQEEAETSLRNILRFTSLVRNIDFLGLDQGKIPIITVHQVKGLEFDYIFILGLNEGSFPLTFKNGNILEEERLFYVALTRAKKNLFLSYSLLDNYNRPLAKSRFIDYIDNQYLKFNNYDQ